MKNRTVAQFEVDSLWDQLADAGAFRTGSNARLDTWLRRHYGVTATVFLSDADAKGAGRMLSLWLDRVLTEKGQPAIPAPSYSPRLVILEVPFDPTGGVDSDYAVAAMADSLSRSEAPFVPSLTYPRTLDFHDPIARWKGVVCGLAWGAKADATIVYADHGITIEMAAGIKRARRERRPVEYRTLSQPL
ncbi:hypothetical protein M2352_003906 [Azospirillum fermentarium]|uniref:regulatory protein GemA n=1 Tax=Azospirillum fermentarium TaxID=1233114 RepID=UPI00222635A1|nr:regulatory protein GemA [Azospirillum fermentarium]MCW2248272.1 hypothetical protein [Azospirillum fermentarium]